jgi:hypothetical protein
LHSIGPVGDCGGETAASKEVSGGFAVTGSKASEVLAAAEGAFDDVREVAPPSLSILNTWLGPKHGCRQVPELPEVETVRRGLEAAMAGARLAAVEQRRPG